MINLFVPIKMEGSAEGVGVSAMLYEGSNQLQVQKRPLILVCPGGGYCHLSDREGDSIAFQFMAMGYHAAVMKYSLNPVNYPTQLLEIAAVVKYFKDHAEELYINPDQIYIYGASAGGHLAASFGTGYFRPEVTQALKVSEDYLKPAGLILAYPVITSGEFAHRGSFEMLLGEKSGDSALLEYVSIENRVNEKAPEAFIWHTFADGAVPVENSLLLAQAYKKANVPFELHIFPSGGHGLALATELTLSKGGSELNEGSAQWISLVGKWLSVKVGSLI